MSFREAAATRINQNRTVRWHIPILSLALLAIGCSSGGKGEPNTVAAGGSSDSHASSAVAGGSKSSIGGTSKGGSGSRVDSGATQGGASVDATGEDAETGGSSLDAARGGSASGGTSGSNRSGTSAVDASGGAAKGGASTAAGGTTKSTSKAGNAAGGATTAATSAGGADTSGQTNPLAHLAPAAKEVGLLLANRFKSQTLAYSSVANLPGDGYKNACEWYGALGVAKHTASQELLTGLVDKFNPFKASFVSAMTGGEAHVDRYIYGIVPLEIYLQTGDESYLPLGLQVADKQQTTNQTRNAIDDMFMMTILQLEAYRASKNDASSASKSDAYLKFMSPIMVTYLKAQKSNGLFFHNETEAKVHWGRGNGWFAAGMAEMLRDLPRASTGDYPTIEGGFTKMMEGLVKVQSKNGLWYQVLDMPDDPSNWEESSGSAMFTYAMIAGVRSGVLDATTYVPVIEKAWTAIRGKISTKGDVSDICVGTWYKASAKEYMGLSRLTGDGHGQAPVLWAAAELLR